MVSKKMGLGSPVSGSVSHLPRSVTNNHNNDRLSYISLASRSPNKENVSFFQLKEEEEDDSEASSSSREVDKETVLDLLEEHNGDFKTEGKKRDKKMEGDKKIAPEEIWKNEERPYKTLD